MHDRAERGTVIVVGSINVDLTIGVPTIPRPGETVLGGDFTRTWGGKGANQAVAAARAGVTVRMIGAVGDDEFGRGATAALEAAGVRTDLVSVVARPTGVASIVVDSAGENAIAVAPGANSQVEVPAELPDIAGAAVVLASLEVGDDALAGAARLAIDRNWQFVINPAPARPLADDVLDARPFMVPNQLEAEALTGESDPARSASQLSRRTGAPVAVTLGADGALLVDAGTSQQFVAPAVTAVDTTGAGDAFCGALAAKLAAGFPLAEAVRAGIEAGTDAVMHRGARA